MSHTRDTGEDGDAAAAAAASTARASSLDITDEAFGDLAARAVELVSDYFRGVAASPVLTHAGASELAARFDAPLPAAPDPLDEVFADCRRIFEGSRHSGHPRFYGYVASPSTPVGAFADLIASALNQNVPAWRSSPAATHVEHTVVRWLAALAGYAEGAFGLLTSGGSMANLNALYVAHRTQEARARDDAAAAAAAAAATTGAARCSRASTCRKKVCGEARDRRPSTSRIRRTCLLRRRRTYWDSGASRCASSRRTKIFAWTCVACAR